MKKITGRFKILAVISNTLLLASITFGCTAAHQTISLCSSPPGARVTINGDFRAFTPTLIDLPKNNEYDVTLTLDNYEPYTLSIKHKIDYAGWVIGNLLWGGLIGMTIDAATGKFYDLTTDDPYHMKDKPIINVKLKPVVRSP